MSKYKLNKFQDHLFDWVNQFRIQRDKGFFSLKANNQTPSLYGLTDMVFNLVIPNRLDDFLTKNEDIEKDEWVHQIQSFQNPKTGWFKDRFFNINFRNPLTGQWEHATAFAVAALTLLDAKPKYKVKFLNVLISKKKVERWLRKTPEWGLLFWPGSHRGGGIGAIIATLGIEKYPHKDFFQWYFDWLNIKADPEVGFWRLGWNHKIKKRLTKHELGGSIHYYWIYEYLNYPLPFPKKIIDSTLYLQNDLGLWDGKVSYCIDLDAIFCLLRCQKLVHNYRDKDIKAAIIKYLDYTIPSLNNKEFLFSHYTTSHKLTGCLGAIAEIYKYYPELVDFPKPWIQTLDNTPWI